MQYHTHYTSLYSYVSMEISKEKGEVDRCRDKWVYGGIYMYVDVYIYICIDYSFLSDERLSRLFMLSVSPSCYRTSQFIIFSAIFIKESFFNS